MPATLGFAIPINAVKTIVTNIQNKVAAKGIVIGESPYLGIYEQTTSSNGLGGFGFNTGNSGNTGNTGNSGNTGTAVAGVTLGGVATGSPAQQAGLAAGDVVTSINGKATATWDALTKIVQRLHPGNTINLAYSDATGVPHNVVLKLSGIAK